MLYYIDRRVDAQLLLSEFPAIVEHVLGPQDAGGNKSIEIWSPEHEAWRGQVISAPILVHRTHALLLVRYPANGQLRGVGARIAMLQREAFSQWLLDRLDEYVDGEADEVRAAMVSRQNANAMRTTTGSRSRTEIREADTYLESGLTYVQRAERHVTRAGMFLHSSIVQPSCGASQYCSINRAPESAQQGTLRVEDNYVYSPQPGCFGEYWV